MTDSKKTRGLITLSILATMGLTSFGAHPAKAQSLEDLKKQMLLMQKRIEQLEAQQKQAAAKAKASPAPAPAPAPAAPPVAVAAAPPPNTAYVKAGSVPGSFLIPGTDTSIKFGGYVKADGIYDAGPQQGDDIDPGATPLRGTKAGHQNSGNFRFTARESRFNVKTFTPTSYGDFKTDIEGDFYGGGGGNSLSTNSYNFRLRQAYGELGPFLAGQSWTTFMDVDALPETLDFNGPTGQVLVRQPQFRYTFATKNAGEFAVALESPQGDFLDADSNVPSSNVSNPTPDFIGHWLYLYKYGQLFASALGRTERIDQGIAGQSKPSIFAYGLEFATVIQNFLGKDNIVFEIAGGNGIGRYFFDNGGGSNLGGGGYSAATSGLATLNPSLRAESTVGGYIGYQHWWSESIRSSAVYGRQENQIDSAIAHLTGVDYNKVIQTVHANLIWSPLPKIDLGVEYIYTKRTNTLSQVGEASRIQVSVKYAF